MFLEEGDGLGGVFDCDVVRSRLSCEFIWRVGVESTSISSTSVKLRRISNKQATN